MKKRITIIFLLIIFLACVFFVLQAMGISTPLSKLVTLNNSAKAFEWEKQVNVYFGNTNFGSSDDCSKVFPVSRNILNAETFGPGAIEALLKGVTEKEKSEGYFSSINNKVLVQKFEIKDKVAYVDFNYHLSEIHGSCAVENVRSQIENTLNNLTDIDTVIISVNGETEGILEP